MRQSCHAAPLHSCVVVVVVLIGMVCEAPALGGDCPFDWLPEEAVPGIETAVLAMTTWDPDGAGPQEPVLVVGGRTKIATNVYTGHVAAWNGETWHSLGSGMNEAVNALVIYNGALIAGGEFSTADGNLVNCISSWNGTSWESVGNGVGVGAGSSITPRVLALMTVGGSLVVGGAFTTAGGQSTSRSVAIWNGSNWQSMNTGLSSAVNAIAVYAGEIIVAGGFAATQGGGTSLNRIARWTGTTWQPLPPGPNSGMNDTVHALAEYDGKLIAGGLFTTAGGSFANSIAQWDGANWSPLGDGMAGSEPTVKALTVYDGKLIAGGRFTSAGGHVANYIAQWDGFDWQAVGSGFNSRTEALLVNEDQLIAGGFFNGGGDDSARVARWGPACLRGDLNCDQVVDDADLPLFAQALVNSPDISLCESFTANANADADSDGTPRIDGLDVAAFIEALFGT